MHKQICLFRGFTEPGPPVALAVAILLLGGIVGPASAQFFNFPNFGGPPRPPPRSGGYGGGGGWFGGGDLFAPFQQQAPKRPGENYSKAPPPEKPDPPIVPERNVGVLGAAMADWPPLRPADGQ